MNLIRCKYKNKEILRLWNWRNGDFGAAVLQIMKENQMTKPPYPIRVYNIEEIVLHPEHIESIEIAIKSVLESIEEEDEDLREFKKEQERLFKR